MCINGSISCSASQVLVFSVRNVLPSFVVSVLLGQTEVDEEQFITMTSDSHQEVVGFDVCKQRKEEGYCSVITTIKDLPEKLQCHFLLITPTSMDEVLVVDKLDAADHLICKHENRLHCKSSRTEVEQVFQTWTQEIHYQDIVVSFLTKPASQRNSTKQKSVREQDNDELKDPLKEVSQSFFFRKKDNRAWYCKTLKLLIKKGFSDTRLRFEENKSRRIETILIKQPTRIS